ncbi:hypothetical protein LINPERPRIM_LOCUS35518 [Linum perenne]
MQLIDQLNKGHVVGSDKDEVYCGPMFEHNAGNQNDCALLSLHELCWNKMIITMTLEILLGMFKKSKGPSSHPTLTVRLLISKSTL